MTGIVDIAMVGSLCKKGEFHNLLNDYGLVLIDECHHAASDTISNVLKEVKAKYVYGVTATPKRGDGLEKINFSDFGAQKKNNPSIFFPVLIVQPRDVMSDVFLRILLFCIRCRFGHGQVQGGTGANTIKSP
jgi:hypothetical protein